MVEWQYGSTILDLGTKDEMNSLIHAPIAFQLGERAPSINSIEDLGGGDLEIFVTNLH